MHMNAFKDAAMTLYHDDGPSMKHLNRYLKRVAKVKKRRDAKRLTC